MSPIHLKSSPIWSNWFQCSTPQPSTAAARVKRTSSLNEPQVRTHFGHCTVVVKVTWPSPPCLLLYLHWLGGKNWFIAREELKKLTFISLLQFHMNVTHKHCKAKTKKSGFSNWLLYSGGASNQWRFDFPSKYDKNNLKIHRNSCEIFSYKIK